MALLGYLYGVHDLYALPMFNSMAVNTAMALVALSVAALLADPRAGWAAVIGSPGAAGGGTRRQLAFVVLPIAAAKLLLWITAAAGVGPGVAMALLVIVTVFPLALLILREGQVLDALDRERRDRVREQDRVAIEMSERLAHQAEELARESDERTRVEAAMNRTQRMEAVGQLTGGIAHDVNNLLMAIRGNLERLDHGLPTGEITLRRYVENATRASDKGAKVAAHLMAFSRSQRRNIRAVELDPVLLGARALLGRSLGPAIDLVMQLDRALRNGGARRHRRRHRASQAVRHRQPQSGVEHQAALIAATRDVAWCVGSSRARPALSVRHAGGAPMPGRRHYRIGGTASAGKSFPADWKQTPGSYDAIFFGAVGRPVETEKFHIDALAARFTLAPSHFDVVVGSNPFGDIPSDLGPALTGTIGIAPSGNITPRSASRRCSSPCTAPHPTSRARASPNRWARSAPPR